tara:strand:- start:1912 stop:2412 length:501 start_codon:yes stop_codon:yes gene_type:complete
MDKITLKWEEILAGATTGLTREIESLRQGIQWGHGANFDTYTKFGMTISGCLAEMSLAKMCQSYFSHSVNNFHGADLIINDKSCQVRSQLMSKKTHNLIVRQNKKKNDYYFLMIDDFPTYYCAGYVAPNDVERLGDWTNFGINERPYVWSIKKEKLKKLKQFKYER